MHRTEERQRSCNNYDHHDHKSGRPHAAGAALYRCTRVVRYDYKSSRPHDDYDDDDFDYYDASKETWRHLWPWRSSRPWKGSRPWRSKEQTARCDPTQEE